VSWADANRKTGAVLLLLDRARRFAWPLLALVLLAFTAFFIGAAVNAKSDAGRSARLHREGIRVDATVSAVANRRTNPHSTDTSRSSFTSVVTLALQPPVRGHDHTALHFSRYSKLVVGQTVTVLVDPRDPGYAEQPGAGTSSSRWKVMTGLAVGTGVLALVVVGFIMRRWRRGRARRDGPALVV